jgi:hypothetical protein
MLRIQLTIAILGVTVIADGQLGIATKIPVKAGTPGDQTHSIAEIAGG